MKMKVNNIDFVLCSTGLTCGAEYLLLDFQMSLG